MHTVHFVEGLCGDERGLVVFANAHSLRVDRIPPGEPSEEHMLLLTSKHKDGIDDVVNLLNDQAADDVWLVGEETWGIASTLSVGKRDGHLYVKTDFEGVWILLEEHARRFRERESQYLGMWFPEHDCDGYATCNGGLPDVRWILTYEFRWGKPSAMSMLRGGGGPGDAKRNYIYAEGQTVADGKLIPNTYMVRVDY